MGAIAIGTCLALMIGAHAADALVPAAEEGRVGFYQRVTISSAVTGEAISFVAPQGWTDVSDHTDGSEASYESQDSGAQLVIRAYDDGSGDGLDAPAIGAADQARCFDIPGPDSAGRICASTTIARTTADGGDSADGDLTPAESDQVRDVIGSLEPVS